MITNDLITLLSCLFVFANANQLKEKHLHPKCETVTVTHITSETLIYASSVQTTLTVTEPGLAKQTVTVTEVVAGGTITVTEGGAAAVTTTVYSTSVISEGGGTTTVTSFVYPNATTTKTLTSTLSVPQQDSTTVFYPRPSIATESFSDRYTGAPSSLFLSVI